MSYQELFGQVVSDLNFLNSELQRSYDAPDWESKYCRDRLDRAVKMLTLIRDNNKSP